MSQLHSFLFVIAKSSTNLGNLKVNTFFSVESQIKHIKKFRDMCSKLLLK